MLVAPKGVIRIFMLPFSSFGKKWLYPYRHYLRRALKKNYSLELEDNKSPRSQNLFKIPDWRIYSCFFFSGLYPWKFEKSRNNIRNTEDSSTKTGTTTQSLLHSWSSSIILNVRTITNWVKFFREIWEKTSKAKLFSSLGSQSLESTKYVIKF